LNHWLDLIMFVAAAAGGLRRNNSKSSSQSPLGNSSNSAINGDNNNGHSANATPLLEGGPGSNNGPIAHTGARGGQAQQLVDQEATRKSARVEQDRKDEKTAVYLSRVVMAESTMPFLAAASISVTVLHIIGASKCGVSFVMLTITVLFKFIRSFRDNGRSGTDRVDSYYSLWWFRRLLCLSLRSLPDNDSTCL
jgi:hypothetical protein